MFHVAVVFTVMAFCENLNVGSSQFALFCSLTLHLSVSKVLVQDSFQRLTCNSSQHMLGSSKSRLTKVDNFHSLFSIMHAVVNSIYLAMAAVPKFRADVVDHHDEVSIDQ